MLSWPDLFSPRGDAGTDLWRDWQQVPFQTWEDDVRHVFQLHPLWRWVPYRWRLWIFGFQGKDCGRYPHKSPYDKVLASSICESWIFTGDVHFISRISADLLNMIMALISVLAIVKRWRKENGTDCDLCQSGHITVALVLPCLTSLIWWQWSTSHQNQEAHEEIFVPRFQMPLTEGHVFQLRGLGPPPLLAVLFAVPSRGRCLPSLWSLQPYDGAGVFNGTLYFCNTLPFTRRRPFEGNLAFTCWKIQC